MLGVPKSSSKDKKVGKEQTTPLRSTVVLNGGSGLPASAYNPLLGTFHTLDTPSTSSAQILHGNGRFRNIDDSENQNGSTNGSGGDYDSASNNDTRSVESEEQNKEKSNAPNKQEVIPGADNDKREKIRQKNERKHQRQKEKRAQELHERCNGYLMSRKLEALAQQLVGMGFSHERATMALILNEGRVEEAVSWLFEGGEESDKHKDRNLDTANNLKIDISEENSRISEMEKKFKCSKQEVERAIVSCEGDLEKSEEVLRSQKQDQPAALRKPEETGDPPSFSDGKNSVAASRRNVRLIQPKPDSVSLLPQRRDDKDLNYNTPVMVGLASKSVHKAVQPVTRVEPKLEWARPLEIVTPAEKSWPVGGGSIPSVSYSSPPLSKVESRFIGNEYKNFQPGSVREPVVMMQRPQSVNTKLAPVTVTSISSSPPGVAGRWYPSSSEVMKSNGLYPHIPSTRSPSPNNLTSNQFYHPTQYQQQHRSFMPGSSPMDNPVSGRVNDSFPRMGGSPTQSFMPGSNPMDNSVSNGVNDSFPRMGASPNQSFMPGSNPMDNPLSNRVNDSFLRVGASPTLAAASSLGLFSGLGSACSSGSTSPVDWNASSSMPSCDYTSIDWSLDKTFLPSKPNSLWLGLGPYSRGNGHIYDSGASAMGVNLALRPSSSTGNGVPFMGLQNGGAATADPSAASSREWTSPFEGRDLFSLPRQFVFSPSL